MSCCEAATYESVFDARHAAKDLRRRIGVVHHELLAAGACSAVHVDAAVAHMQVAREEAVRRGHADRVTFVRGDFVELAPEIPARRPVSRLCAPDGRDRFGDPAAGTREAIRS